MLDDGISIGSIVAVNLHENHTISLFFYSVEKDIESGSGVTLGLCECTYVCVYTQARV